MARRLPFKQLMTNLIDIFGHRSSSTIADKTDILYNKCDSIWGRSQIIEIIGNVTIPFFFYESIQKESFGFREYIIDFYYYLPQDNCYAKLRSFNRWRKGHHPHLRRFYVNQALLLLKIQFCKFASCSFCPLRANDKQIDINLENI